MPRPSRLTLLLVLWTALLLCGAYLTDARSLIDVFESVGPDGLLAWTALTMSSRWMQALTASIPMRKLGIPLVALTTFWLAWVRTFANQFVPVSGVIAYLRVLREITGATYAQLSALATPQVLLAATALGLTGTLAALCNLTLLGSDVVFVAGISTALIVMPLLIARHAPRMMRWFPAPISMRLEQAEQAFDTMSRDLPLIASLVAIHSFAIILRGLRVVLLFYCVGIPISPSEALLLMFVSESTLIIQLTPGGLVLREGAIVGGALMLGIALDAAATVAIADRLLVTGITFVMAAPALWALKSLVIASRNSSRECT